MTMTRRELFKATGSVGAGLALTTLGFDVK